MHRENIAVQRARTLGGRLKLVSKCLSCFTGHERTAGGGEVLSQTVTRKLVSETCAHRKAHGRLLVLPCRSHGIDVEIARSLLNERGQRARLAKTERKEMPAFAYRHANLTQWIVEMTLGTFRHKLRSPVLRESNQRPFVCGEQGSSTLMR
jgi:hypothetical protein